VKKKDFLGLPETERNKVLAEMKPAKRAKLERKLAKPSRLAEALSMTVGELAHSEKHIRALQDGLAQTIKELGW